MFPSESQLYPFFNIYITPSFYATPPNNIIFLYPKEIIISTIVAIYLSLIANIWSGNKYAASWKGVKFFIPGYNGIDFAVILNNYWSSINEWVLHIH